MTSRSAHLIRPQVAPDTLVFTGESFLAHARTGDPRHVEVGRPPQGHTILPVCFKGATSREPPHVFPLEHTRAGQPRHYQFQTFPLVDSIGADATAKSRPHPASNQSLTGKPNADTRHGAPTRTVRHGSLTSFTRLRYKNVFYVVSNSTQCFTSIVFESSIRNSMLYASLGVLGWANRRHPATCAFGNTSGRTTLVQLSSHEFQTHPSRFCLLLGSTANLNEARRDSRFSAWGKPSRRFCTTERQTTQIRRVDFFGHSRKHSGERTYLKMIGQPSGVLEYDAVLTINDEFREAVS
jgi:hypothetical protein